MATHDLKIKPEHFYNILMGIKTAELRLNDRDYRVGDILCLREYVDGNYTCYRIFRRISHVLDDEEYLQPGYVMLSLVDDVVNSAE